MTQPLLSILIPTVFNRNRDVQRLLDLLYVQMCEIPEHDVNLTYVYEITSPESNPYIVKSNHNSVNIQCIICADDKTMTIGEKREKLYQMSDGLFSWQIDDDDSIATNAIELILEAIKSNPEVDVISFEEYCNMDGKEYKSNHSLEYGDWEGDGHTLLSDGFHFHRTPFFKSVIKTEIAKSIPIPHIRFGEDHQWAQALKPHLKTEIHIPEQIYRYIHISSDHNERYGIKD